jgi:hypothetical protein
MSGCQAFHLDVQTTAVGLASLFACGSKKKDYVQGVVARSTVNLIIYFREVVVGWQIGTNSDLFITCLNKNSLTTSMTAGVSCLFFPL